MSDAEPEGQHIDQMELIDLWVCNDCGMVTNSWSKRHIVEEHEDTVTLDAPCPICRSDEWMPLVVIGKVAT